MLFNYRRKASQILSSLSSVFDKKSGGKFVKMESENTMVIGLKIPRDYIHSKEVLSMVKTIIDIINENKGRIIVSWSLNTED